MYFLQLVKKNSVIISLLVVTIIGTYIVSTNYDWYDSPLVKVIRLSETPSTNDGNKKQMLTTKRLNGPNKNQTIKITNSYTYSQAITNHYKVGDILFIENSGDNTMIKNVKRDHWLWFLTGLFILIIVAVGKKSGYFTLLSTFINSALFILLLFLYTNYPSSQLLPLMIIFSLLSILVTSIFVNGWNKKSLIMSLGTATGTFSAWGVGLLVMNLTNNNGLRFEEMNFLTRPYRPIFTTSLLIGTLGATTDIATTIISTIYELHAQNKSITSRQLSKAGFNVGKNILGPMSNILFFVYISEGIPLILLYLENGWSYGASINATMSLEIMRALVGALGITLTVPCSVFFANLLITKEGENDHHSINGNHPIY